MQTKKASQLSNVSSQEDNYQYYQKKSKAIPQQIQKRQKKILQVYDQFIDKLSQQKQQFYRQIDYFWLTTQEISFLEKIQKGQLFTQQTLLLQKYFNSHAINTYIQVAKQRLNRLKQSLSCLGHNFYKNTRFPLFQKLNLKISDSKIISCQTSNYLIQKWINQEMNFEKPIKFTLLFRASEKKFKSLQFHKSCNDHKNTIVLIRTQYGKIVGGFTPLSWSTKKQNHDQLDQSKKTFIFSLTNKQKYSQCQDAQVSISHYGGNGPIFGNQIAISQNSIKGFCSFPKYFNIKQNPLKVNNERGKQMFLGSGTDKDIKIQQYQVYKVTEQK